MIDPIDLFLETYEEARRASLPEEAEAMVLATATKEARPSARVVLYRGWYDGKLAFYTNYDSRKGLELEANPYASVVFFWKKIHKQVRIEGSVEKLPAQASDQYWASRHRGSQISGTISPQSRPIASLHALQTEAERLEEKLGDQPIPRPENWGGFGIKPERMEFWSLGNYRMHERVLFILEGQRWTRSFLAP